MNEKALRVVLKWEDAVNSSDADRLMKLVSKDIAIVGPRGKSVGREELRQWLGRARLRAQAHRAFVKDGTVVVAQNATWHSHSGAVLERAEIASRFIVPRSVVTEYERYDSLDEALKATGLSEADEVPIDRS